MAENQRDIENPGDDGGNEAQGPYHQIICKAAKRGDWESAKQILDINVKYACDRITKGGDRALHIAAAGKHSEFVKQLVMRLNPEDMELKNDRGCTAFCYAVVSGVVANAKVMIIKNRNLSTIRAYDDMIPIHQAALLGHKEMVSFLCTVTPFQELIYQERIEILEATIRNDMYDEALNFFHKDRRLASARLKGNRSMLNLLARKLQALTTEKQEGRGLAKVCWLNFCIILYTFTQEQSSPPSWKARKLLEEMWEEYSNLTEKFAHLIRPQQILHCAAKEGNDQFLDMILHTNPDLLWELNEKRQSILHVAVFHRQEKVVRLICSIHGYKDFITLLEDKDRNNVLHLAAMTQTTFYKDNNENPLLDEQLAQRVKEEEEKIMPQSLLRLSTAALQFDKEISWFKDMENMMPPSLCDMLNDDDKTPKQLFSKEHMSLKIEGEKSIRDTAKSCMLVATLIATVAFSAIFTVPGGNHQEGAAGARKKTVFTVSDAVAMIYSMVSIVNFLSILILRYTEDNFHVALKRLFMGLAALGVSIAGMLVAFTAAFFLVYNKALVPILIAVFSGVPVALFWFLNTKLWFESTASMFRNLYRFIRQ